MELKHRTYLFLISLILTIALLRIFLTFSPSSNLYIFGYNVHHLFIGAFLVIVILIFFIFNLINKFTIILAGVSSALVLDEIIYLIATDGSDLSYLTPVSLWGAITITAIILTLAIILYNAKKHKLK